MSIPGTMHLVVPCFHESRRITKFLPDLCDKMDAEGGCRVLVVEDGSGDDEQKRMSAIVDQLRPDHPCLDPLLSLPENLGKGGAVYAGWREAEGAEWLGFVDADGACPPSEVLRLVRLAKGAPEALSAIFASRTWMLGRSVQRPWHRNLSGRLFSMIVAALLGIPVHDSQCGLKLIRRDGWERIAPFLRVHDFGFDIELLAALHDAGCRIEEVPIDWHEVPGGKLRLVRDAARMFQDVLQVRRRRRRPGDWLRASGQ